MLRSELQKRERWLHKVMVPPEASGSRWMSLMMARLRPPVVFVLVLVAEATYDSRNVFNESIFSTIN